MSIMAQSKPPKPTIEGLQRTKSDIPFNNKLPTLSEIEEAKCECCGMSEECTPEYIEETRKKYARRLICGLCGEAVKEEMEKNGGRAIEEALELHMSACVRFNKIGRVYPALYQADNVRKILKKSASTTRVKSSGTTTGGGGFVKGAITRSSSCIPAITDDVKDKLRV